LKSLQSARSSGKLAQAVRSCSEIPTHTRTSQLPYPYSPNHPSATHPREKVEAPGVSIALVYWAVEHAVAGVNKEAAQPAGQRNSHRHSAWQAFGEDRAVSRVYYVVRAAGAAGICWRRRELAAASSTL
jgi:hypothetical protein